jgi:predicted transcriptional regulator
MVLTKQTVAVYLRIDLIDEAKRRNLNLSQLINRLLEEFLFGNSTTFSEDYIRLKELNREFETLKKKVEEFEKELKELNSKAEEEVMMQEAENEAHLIAALKEHPVLSKLNDFWSFKYEAERIGNTVEGIVNTNLQIFATKNQISLKKAQELFFKAFPEMKDKVRV